MTIQYHSMKILLLNIKVFGPIFFFFFFFFFFFLCVKDYAFCSHRISSIGAKAVPPT